jgi:hypothetical protein
MYNPQQNPNTIQASDLQNQGKRQKGSGFTNINRLLGANVGAGAQMGQQIGGGIGQQAGKVAASATAGTNKFLGDYAASKGSALNTLGGVSNLAGNVGAGGEVGTGSALGSLSEGEAAQKGREFADVGYKGPTALAGSQQLSGQASTLGESGKAALGGSMGQKSLLQSMVARPGQYTRGQSTLDTTLLGQSGQAQQAMQQGAQQAFQAQRNVAAQQANASNLARQAASTISQQKGDIGGLLNKKVQDIQTAAGTQAETFGKGATRLKELMTGTATTADGKPITSLDQLTPEDKALLNSTSQYGLDTGMNFYTGNADSSNMSLNALGGSLSLSPGALKYQDDQQAAARNLALMTQQDDLSSKIGKNKFESNVFSQDPKLLQEQNLAKEADLAQQSKGEALVNQAQSLAQTFAKAVSDNPFSNNLGGPFYEALESAAPGIRSAIDKLPPAFRKEYYIKAAQAIIPQLAARGNAQASQYKQKIAENTKDVRSGILQRLSGKSIPTDYKF